MIRFNTVLLALLCLSSTSCIKKREVISSVQTAAAPKTELLDNVSQAMIDKAAEGFSCIEDNEKSQFSAGLNAGWKESVSSYNEKQDLDKWFLETKSGLISKGTQAAGESLPVSHLTEQNLPNNRCQMLGSTAAYTWFFYGMMTQMNSTRCTLPATRVGSYAALIFYRLQSLHVDEQGKFASFALPLSQPLIGPSCGDAFTSACNRAYADRLNLIDTTILANSPSEPKRFGEVFCN